MSSSGITETDQHSPQVLSELQATPLLGHPNNEEADECFPVMFSDGVFKILTNRLIKNKKECLEKLASKRQQQHRGEQQLLNLEKDSKTKIIRKINHISIKSNNM